MNQLNSHI